MKSNAPKRSQIVDVKDGSDFLYGHSLFNTKIYEIGMDIFNKSNPDIKIGNVPSSLDNFPSQKILIPQRKLYLGQ